MGGAGGTGGIANTGGVGGSESGGAGGSAQAGTAGNGASAGSSGASGSGAAAGEAGSSGQTGGTGASAGFGPGTLDPQLALPDASGAACEVGAFCWNNIYYACRIASPTDGRCETCLYAALCGVQGSSCTKSNECGTLYQCYAGKCSSICKLGVDDPLCDAQDCRDVGHVTHGVCVRN